MSKYPPSPIKALVVEDYEMSSIIIQDMLHSLGLEVTVASNGEQALKMANTNTFSIIFMDIQLADESGIEITKQIRNLNINQPVIIACTANAAVSNKEECLSSGMDDFLLKPVKVNTFKEMIEKHQLKTKDSRR